MVGASPRTILSQRWPGDNGPGLRSDEPVMHGVAHELGGGFQSELAHNIPAVRFHGLGADAERRGDLFVALAFRHPHDNVTLTIRQLGGSCVRLGRVCAQRA